MTDQDPIEQLERERVSEQPLSRRLGLRLLCGLGSGTVVGMVALVVAAVAEAGLGGALWLASGAGLFGFLMGPPGFRFVGVAVAAIVDFLFG